MKYIKHMTNCSNDPKIQAVIEEFGPHGYAAYWLILERVAAEFNGESSRENLKLPAKTWQKITFFSRKKLEIFLNFCKKIELFFHFWDSCYITITIPKLLKYGDEYAQRLAQKSAKMSGQTPAAFNSPSPSPRKETTYYDNTTVGGAGAGHEF
jgi:hypothetical protein